MAAVRFCAYQYQHHPLDELRRRWLLAERLDFDVLWNCDTVVEPDRTAPPHVRWTGDPDVDGIWRRRESAWARWSAASTSGTR